MQVYDKVIEKTRELLKPFPAKELNRNHAKSWNLLKENEFLLQKAVAFELGIRSQPSTCLLYTSGEEHLAKEMYNIGDSSRAGRVLEAVRGAYHLAVRI